MHLTDIVDLISCFLDFFWGQAFHSGVKSPTPATGGIQDLSKGRGGLWPMGFCGGDPSGVQGHRSW